MNNKSLELAIIGKMNLWNRKSNSKEPNISYLILKLPNVFYCYYLVSRPFYIRLDNKSFASLKSLKQYYEYKVEKEWLIEWKLVSESIKEINKRLKGGETR